MRRHHKPTNKSWRVDETYVRVKAAGASCIGPSAPRLIFCSRLLRDADAAKRLFRKALSTLSHPRPRVINTDLALIYGSAIRDIKKEGTLRCYCRHRPVQYLNNISSKTTERSNGA